MNFIKNLIPFIILFYSSFNFADTINESLIFSDDTPTGAALCSDIQADAYCEKEVPTYSAEGTELKTKEKLQSGCVRGGGDCTMAIFILKTKPSGTDKLLALVKSDKQKQIWIQIPKGSLKNIEELIPELGTGENFVSFRPSLKIYSDKDLKKTIEIADIMKTLENKNIDPNVEAIEFLELPSFKKENEKIINLQINLIKKDLSASEDNPLQAIEKGKRIKLRTIYFRAKDEKGRINYWYQPQSC